ncbi:MAG TPA: hypothetical protein VLE69_01555 [Candidatus Saccharimonadales bacterium]|nr:hypothetical protein [Candidatus Saccharimonadales bacterium]
MEQTTTLRELVGTLDTTPVDADTATALIASVPPRKLRAAADGVFMAVHGIEFRRELMDQAGVIPTEYPTTESLREITNDMNLALDIENKRLKFSKPARWLTAILCAVTLGAGASGFVYATASESNNRAAEITQKYNKELDSSHQLPEPDESLDSGQKELVVEFGAAGTFVGAVYGGLLGFSLSDRFARRKAKNILRKQAS